VPCRCAATQDLPTGAIRRKSTAFLDKKSQYPIKRVKKQHEAQKN